MRDRCSDGKFVCDVRSCGIFGEREAGERSWGEG